MKYCLYVSIGGDCMLKYGDDLEDYECVGFCNCDRYKDVEHLEY